MKTVDVKYDNNHRAIIDFVNETRDGKYTVLKPEVEFTYQRIEIQEQNESIDLDDFQNSAYLFGITS